MAHMQQMLLASQPAIITLSGASISDLNNVGGTATASLIVRADGTVDKDTASGGTEQLSSTTDWVRPLAFAAGTMNLFVRATLQAGVTPDVGTLDTWLALSSDRTWTLTVTGASTSEACTLLIEIAGSPQQAMASGTYTLAVDVT